MSRCCYFALRADNKAAIARAGAVEALVVLLRGDGGGAMKRSAAAALGNLSANNAGVFSAVHALASFAATFPPCTRVHRGAEHTCLSMIPPYHSSA